MSNIKVTPFFPGASVERTNTTFGISDPFSLENQNNFSEDSLDLLSMMMPSYPANSLDVSNSSPISGSKRAAPLVNSNSNPQKKNPTKKRKLTDNDPSPYNSQEESTDSASVDEKKAKRQKRLVKNREAAQLFRQRQKNYIQDLEKKVEGLIADNQQFTTKAELLESENRLLRDQLAYLRGFLSQIMAMAFPTQSAMGAFTFPTMPPANIQSIPKDDTTCPTQTQTLVQQATNISQPTTDQPEPNPAHSVAAAFQAAMGFSNLRPDSSSGNSNS